MKMSTEALARRCARRPWLTIGVWAVVFVVAGYLNATLLGDALTSTGNFTNNPESKQAQDLVHARLHPEDPLTEFAVVTSRTLTVNDEAFRTVVEDIDRGLKAIDGSLIAATRTYYLSNDPTTLVSRDGHTTLIPILFTGTFDDVKDEIERVHDVTIDPSRPADVRVLMAGTATVNQAYTELAEDDLRRGEGIGLPVAFLVLILVFGAVVAAIMPVLVGLLAIVTALGAVGLLGIPWDFAFFVTNMVTMMGLAVGIDYSLFIISRFREERAHGRATQDAIAAAAATSSRAVLFSGLTVVFALAGMLIIPVTIFRSLAGGAILVVLAAVAASLTLLPAVLSLLGDRVNKLRIKRLGGASAAERPGSFWDVVTRRVMRRPVVSIVVAAALLLAAGSQVLTMKTGFSGVDTIPEGQQSKEAFEILGRDFSAGLTVPAWIVIDGQYDVPAVQSAIGTLEQRLASDPRFGPPFPIEVSRTGDLALLQVPLKAHSESDEAETAIRSLRATIVPSVFRDVPARVLVGGQTAGNVDFFDLTRTYTPIVFAFVLGLSFLLLMVVFRSLVVPLKAIVLNLLSVGATYGVIVLVNQKGYGDEIFGFQRVSVIEAWLPLFLFSVLFGLSMDYHVFLLSRIREHYVQTGDNRESVAFGVRSTAGIITGAALIMVAVFGGFAAGELVMLQQMGFGLAIAVLLDATIVRTVLVPSSMELLGNANWYLPKWLGWLPHIHVGEAASLPALVSEERHVIDLTDGERRAVAGDAPPVSPQSGR